MTDTKPTGMTIPPSAEYMLPIVRQRLHDLEEAVEAFLSVMETTGTERGAAYEAWNKHTLTGDEQADAVRWAKLALNFRMVYGSTLPVRLEALTTLHEAMTMDFETALICAPDTTNEHLSEWLPQLEGQ